MIDTSKPHPEPAPTPSPKNPARNVRDVADFHLRWPEFRPIAKALGRNPALSEAEADTLAWMVELLDRIGPRDVEDGGK
ncbi:hypothetical protein GC209_02170 [bacterium]|nr:hypothetical protein [bacterium]